MEAPFRHHFCGAFAMGAARDPIREYMLPSSKQRHQECKICQEVLYNNPTLFKKHIGSTTCTPPPDVCRDMLQRQLAGRRSGDSAQLRSKLEAMEGECEQNTKQSRTERGSGSFCTAAGSINNSARCLLWKESQEIDIKCARWIYRRALPLTTIESEEFKAFCRSLNAAHSRPSRFSLAGVHPEREFKAIACMVDEFVRRSVSVGDFISVGDGWSDRLRDSIYNVMLFVPEPVYVETKAWGEAKRTAV